MNDRITLDTLLLIAIFVLMLVAAISERVTF